MIDHARFIDGCVTHRLDEPIFDNERDIQDREFVSFAVESFSNAASRGNYVTFPGYAPIVDFAGGVNPGTQFEIANKYVVRELQ